MKCEADAKPMILARKAIGSTSAPYNQVVLFNIPSALITSVDTEHGEYLAEFVVGILKLALHNCGVYFHNHNR
ncbi:Uncharacterized protein HZ326_20068 [Fusarium oxysporum f. sp. albedinis]|nr:Uncharacterized protein HZ326_20068 [Fusarium oxysporum f. sp. albedinis]